MTLITVDGVTLHYRIDGAASLPLLVLSNGLGLDLSMWDPQIAALSQQFRMLRYDTRGHGASDCGTEPFSIERLGRDVLELLATVGDDRMYFCGLSMGGQIGLWLGIHSPHKLTRLVLAHTAARIGPESMWNARIETVLSSGMKAVSAAAMTRWFTPTYIAAQSRSVAALRATMEHCSASGYAQCCAAVRDADFRDEAARIGCPTLVIGGKHDIATTIDDAHFLTNRIAGAELVEIDAAHLSNIERPGEFSDALLTFLCNGSRATPPAPARIQA